MGFKKEKHKWKKEVINIMIPIVGDEEHHQVRKLVYHKCECGEIKA